MRLQTSFKPRQHGFNLLEVVIGIAIFAIGMLALASLQGALTRSAAESHARSAAVGIAEQEIENYRGFSRVAAGATANVDYNEIVTASSVYDCDPVTTGNQPCGGVTYSVNTTVTDWYYDSASDAFVTTAPTGALASDYKEVDVTVSWDDVRDFRVDDNTAVTSAGIGGGSVTLSAIISSTPTPESGRVALETGDDILEVPAISYTPGQNPDVIPLQLGTDKFKESTTPRPDVIRSDELVETTWDVITYSSDGNTAEFLRREEFTAVSCECTFGSDSTVQGRRPVYWAGDEYQGGEFVDKPYGVSANNQQSDLCTACCRDHHDGGTGDVNPPNDANMKLYDPFKASTEYTSGNHKHYRYSGGTLIPVTTGGYLEVCKMVRVDGFFRVAQDLRQEDLNVFPNNYLDDSDEIGVYSSYVTNAVDEYEAAAGAGDYTSSPPVMASTDPSCNGNNQQICPPVFGGGYPTNPDTSLNQFPSWAAVNNSATPTDQEQMRSRGVYVDYLHSDLRSVIACLRSDPDTCTTNSDGDISIGDITLDRSTTTNFLELTPFFDTQLTFLNEWVTSPLNDPLRLTDEPLADDNTHSRGLLDSVDLGTATGEISGWIGNLGLTNTVVFNNSQASRMRTIDLCAHDAAGAGCGATPPSPSGYVITGQFSESVSGNPTIAVSGSGGSTSCVLATGGFTCTIDDTATSPTLTVSGYRNNAGTQVRYACSVGANTMTISSQNLDPTNLSTTFSLAAVTGDGSGYDVTIQTTSCAPPPP